MASRDGKIGGWLRSLVIGTFLGAWTFATALSFLDKRLAWVPYVGWVKWFVYMTLLTALAFAQVLVVAAVDVVFLKLKTRTLPTGWRAFGAAFSAPIAVGAIVRVWPGTGVHAVQSSLFAALLTTIFVAFGIRLMFGERVD